MLLFNSYNHDLLCVVENVVVVAAVLKFAVVATVLTFVVVADVSTCVVVAVVSTCVVVAEAVENILVVVVYVVVFLMGPCTISWPWNVQWQILPLHSKHTYS